MKFLERGQTIPSAIVNRIPKTVSRIQEVKSLIENQNVSRHHPEQGNHSNTVYDNEGIYDNNDYNGSSNFRQQMHMMVKSETPIQSCRRNFESKL